MLLVGVTVLLCSDHSSIIQRETFPLVQTSHCKLLTDCLCCHVSTKTANDERHFTTRGRFAFARKNGLLSLKKKNKTKHNKTKNKQKKTHQNFRPSSKVNILEPVEMWCSSFFQIRFSGAGSDIQRSS